MTDPIPPSYPGDVVFTGQRRPANSGPNVPFRGRFDPPAGEQVEEVVPEDGTGDTEGYDACADPAAVLDYNADAAAAEALRRMQVDANDPLLDSRERSFVIARNPVTGQIYLGNMRVGDPFAGEVPFDMTGINPEDIIGLVHSHPGSGPYPSGPDRQSVYPFWRGQIGDAAGNPDQLRMYMIGTHNDASGAHLQIRVYDHRNMEPEPGPENPGPEVNPDAQPCP